MRLSLCLEKFLICFPAAAVGLFLPLVVGGGGEVLYDIHQR